MPVMALGPPPWAPSGSFVALGLARRSLCSCELVGHGMTTHIERHAPRRAACRQVRAAPGPYAASHCCTAAAAGQSATLPPLTLPPISSSHEESVHITSPIP